MKPSAELRAQLRRQLREARRQLSPLEQQQAAERLLEHCISALQLPRIKRVAMYLANDGEVDLQPLIEHLWHANIEVTLPVLHPFTGKHLLFQHYTPSTTMHLNRFRIEEPALNCQNIRLLRQHDVILLPLVGFDDSGNRLGMGGGFYDRTLAGLERDTPPLLLGVAHDCQQVDSLPIAAWDIPLDGILTPSRQIRIKTALSGQLAATH